LAISLFVQLAPINYFEITPNFIFFLNSLPRLTQERICNDLGFDTFEQVSWNFEVSHYFVNTFGLHDKFLFNNVSVDVDQSHSITYFNKPEFGFKQLKDYQYKLYTDVSNYLLNTPHSRCILRMPTGSGKTRTAIEIVSLFLNVKQKSVLWLCNTQELCDQAYSSFCEIWYFLKLLDSQAINHVKNRLEVGCINLPTFHVVSIQSLHPDRLEKNLSQYGIDLEKIELVVVDEAHISIAPTYKKAISFLISKGAKLLGLTATPGRNSLVSDNSENQELSDFYFNKLFDLDSGDQTAFDFLRQKGIMANCTFHSIEGIEVESLLSPKDLKLCLENKVIPQKIESLLTNSVQRNKLIFVLLKKLIDQKKKILYFATSVDQSYLMTALLKHSGYSCEHIDSNSGKYRRKIIDDFRSSRIQVLSNYGVLSTGFDDPQIDVVFVARPTNSIVLYSQIIGRGLRGPRVGGTDFCDVYTVFDNILDMPNNSEIYNYFDNYFNNTYDT
jgi:superfamily II DNA or RNA helicase